MIVLASSRNCWPGLKEIFCLTRREGLRRSPIAAATSEYVQECHHLCQHRCLTMILQMQEMANTVDLGIAHIAEILSQPGDFIIGHYRTQLCLAPH